MLEYGGSDRGFGTMAEVRQAVLDNTLILAAWLWEGVLHRPAPVEPNDVGQFQRPHGC